MKFIDEAKVFLKAGDGGDGSASFRREKFIEFGGPDGGNGGKGGDIIFVADRNVNTLLKFRYNPHIKSENGKPGMGAQRTGLSGQDIIRTVPIGTEILLLTEELEEELIVDLKEHGQTFTICYGGKGGKGNINYKTSTRQAPRLFSHGLPGDEKTILLKLKILADIGLVGLPNAGKSTFLSLCSNAKPKIADYPFSTLTPTLGIVQVRNSEMVLADIPGIIRDAHKGVGLGHQFLRHIERCKALVYMIDVTSEDVVETYNTLKSELELYNRKLEEKLHLAILTKCDLVSAEVINQQKLLLQKVTNAEIVTSSITQNLLITLDKIYSLIDINDEDKQLVKFDPIIRNCN